MKKVIFAQSAPAAVGPYSHAIEAGGTLYISGQIPVDGATSKIAETIEEQTHQSLKNLGYILEEAGYSFGDVVKTTVLLDDMADFAAMNAIYATYFTSEQPARVCYEVSKLPLGVKLEIDAIAIKG